jgi:fructose/tagatose bisphosphate aldolase
MIEKLVREAVFGKNKKGAREKIKELTEKNGIWLDSTQKLYDKMMGIVLEEQSLFTVPAFNIRTLTFDVAKAVFRAVKKEKVGAFIFEIARSEINYTGQSPEEYMVVILGAAIEEGFKGPLFFQGDHFQINSKKYFSRTWKAKELKELKNLIRRAIRAGFYNIDIDCSTLKPLKENFSLTAKFTSFIRKIEPKGLTISVGGEVGKIGGENTTLEEFKGFIEGYNQELSQYGKLKGLIRIAVQTGTAHGKGGKTDFQLLQSLTEKAREYNIAGVVQHGASTLSKEEFKKFPEVGTLEIHLATEFQNMILDSPYFPQELKEKIDSKKDLGPFKKEIWGIPQKNIDKICEELEEKFLFFFKKLNVFDTSDLIRELYSKI